MRLFLLKNDNGLCGILILDDSYDDIAYHHTNKCIKKLSDKEYKNSDHLYMYLFQSELSLSSFTIYIITKICEIFYHLQQNHFISPFNHTKFKIVSSCSINESISDNK